jgi:hypothetical protein
VGHIVEVASTGFDESVGGITSNPFGGVGTFVGLRIPSLVPAAAPGPLGRYLFLLASRTLHAPTRLRGIGQLLSIAANLPRTVGETTTPELPFEFDCVSPEFKFADGNVSWHLVLEPYRGGCDIQPLTDTASFRQGWSEAPALLYQTFTSTAITGTGAPTNYPITLTAYTPPTIWGSWTPLVEGLWTWNDIRFPWSMPPGQDLIDVPIEVSGGAMRCSLYASVLQTAGGVSMGTVQPTIPAIPSPLPASFFAMPEWGFIGSMVSLTPPAPVIYWRIGGRLRFEDEERPTRIVVPGRFDEGPNPKASPPGDPEPADCDPCK